jgi:transcriptional regulator with XRE-family HTH domain
MQINIPQRLKSLRSEHRFKALYVAGAIGMKRGSYLAYEEGRATPPLEKLFSLSKLYGFRSIDELLGVSAGTGNEVSEIANAYHCADAEKRKIVDFILNLNC